MLDFDLLEKEIVLARGGQAKVGLWAIIVQVGLFKKLGIFRQKNQVFLAGVGGKRDAGLYKADISLDLHGPQLSSNGNAVIAIHHEIGFTHLINFDRWEALQIFDDHFDPRPPLPVFIAER